ncbi:MAG TPA: glycosyltransferase family 39 protein [Steroidobacteraceae bacterium]|nr:glycosyltransferase family 39 protein [Steroidobacteraceae bacterium]
MRGELAWRDRLWLALAVLAVAISWIAQLGDRPLFNPDEGRYAEIPREMLVSGDWVVPHIDALVYIEKPPLQYWASALGYELFGLSDWSARLYAGLMGLATVLLTGWLAQRLWGAVAGYRAAIVCASSMLLMLMSHQLTLDMGLTFFTTLTLAAFCVAQDARTPEPRRSRWMLLAWAGAAGAFLTKGLVAGALPVLVLIIYTAWQRDARPWRRLALLPGVALFALLVLPWLIAIEHRVPQFFQFFFVREHLQRYLTRIEARYQPWWFFLEVLAIGCLPWLLPTLRALLNDWRATRARGEFDVRRLLWVWCLTVLVFFSASDSKLIPYILPLFPALALLIGSAPEEPLRADLRATGLGLIAVGVLVALGAALLSHLVHDPSRVAYFLPTRRPLLGVALLCVVGGSAAWRARGDALALAALIGATSYGCFLCILWAARLLAPLYSGAPLIAQLPAPLRAVATVYSVRTYDQSLTFYLRRTVTLVEYRGELDFGLTLAPQREIATLAQFEARWRSGAQALAVMSSATYAQLVRDRVPMVLRAAEPHELIVSRD